MPTSHHPLDANALAVVDVTTATEFSADQARAAWATLKARRGQSFDPSQLRPAHIIATDHASHSPTVTSIDAVRDRVSARIRAHIARAHADQINGGAA